MTRQLARTDPEHYMRPERTPRLRLKSLAPQNGCVGGAWWPRSDDLAAELPELLAVLSVRLGRIDRILYGPSEWARTPPTLVADAYVVRLDGYRLQPASTVEVVGLNRDRIVLLVVPPHTDPGDAHTTMMTVVGLGNVSTVDSLLGVSARDRKARIDAVAARERWESDGSSQMNVEPSAMLS